MNLDPQTWAALGMVAVATAYLARRAWQAIAQRKGCGACGTCPMESSKAPTLVSLETARPSKQPPGN